MSVVIPCYNQAHFLSEAIESVLAQSYPNFEVVVVDDGSTDDTSEVARRYSKVQCIRQENQGLSAARNTGLGHSRGEYVVFLDADDRLLPIALEVGVGQLESHPECAFVSGHITYIAADGSSLGTPRKKNNVEDHYLRLLRYNPIWTPAAVMFRRTVFQAVGDFDTSVNPTADWDLYLRIARRFPVRNHGEVVAEYRQHGANMTGNPALMLKATVAVLHAQRKHVKGNKRYQKACRTGLRKGQEYYGLLLADEVRADAWKREWKRALQGALVLLRYYPQGVALLNERRMKRYKEQRELARQIQSRKQDLKFANSGLRIQRAPRGQRPPW